jgi:hypothetical protein
LAAARFINAKRRVNDHPDIFEISALGRLDRFFEILTEGVHPFTCLTAYLARLRSRPS